MTVYIVTRHEGAVRWLQSIGYEGQIVDHVDEEFIRNLKMGDTFIKNLKMGDTVVGVLPMPLVEAVLAQGAEFFLLALPQVAFSDRGREMSPEEMEKAGAQLFQVRRLTLERVA